MFVIPAVDIKEGKAVRLKQGKAEEKTIYDNDPVHAALRWAETGAERIHIIDLDGAFEGLPKNRTIVLNILKALVGHEVELGGGLRTDAIVADYINGGAARCVIGTKALEDRAFLKNLATRFPGKINVGLDAKDGFVMTKGWLQSSTVKAVDLVQELADLPLGEIIYTDIDCDGMLEGPNFKQLEDMMRVSPFPLIASGGVTTIENIIRCKEMGCFGAIVGKAFYDDKMDPKEAIAAGK